MANITTTVLPVSAAGFDRTLRVINQMVADGVIKSYALGGAFGAFFYVEPDYTEDVDIFCVLKVAEEDGLAILRPIYEYLIPKGYKPDVELINIEGNAVQFLPVFNDLSEEAEQHARDTEYEGVPIRVLSPEYLVALMIQTGRPKDFLRVARFVDAGAFNPDILWDILQRHELTRKWKTIQVLERRLSR